METTGVMAGSVPAFEPSEVQARIGRGEVRVLDVRPLQAYLRGHVPGCSAVPYVRRQFALMVQTLVPTGLPLIVVADGAVITREAAHDLDVAGHKVAGALDGGLAAWEAAGLPVEAVEMVEPAELTRRTGQGAVTVIDVREPHEWSDGVIPGARRIPLGALLSRMGELDPAQATAVVCASGNRSLQAAWLLQQRGFGRVANLVGGMYGWQDAGLPVE